MIKGDAKVNIQRST